MLEYFVFYVLWDAWCCGSSVCIMYELGVKLGGVTILSSRSAFVFQGGQALASFVLLRRHNHQPSAISINSAKVLTDKMCNFICSNVYRKTL